MKDKYDEAIEYLTAHPSQIETAWGYTQSAKGGCLFNYCGPRLGTGGCLTQVKSGIREAFTDHLTNAIRDDARIPSDSGSITVNDLPVFAEWQRRIDKELNRA